MTKLSHRLILGLTVAILAAIFALSLVSCFSLPAGDTEPSIDAKENTEDEKHPSDKAKEEEEDPLEGTTWIAGDGSEMVFGTDGILSWYQEEGVHDGDLVEGPYEAHRGEEARDFIVEDLAEFGFTTEELDGVMASRDDGFDNFVAFTLEHEKVIAYGEEIDVDSKVIVYFGFFLEDDTKIEVVNATTGTVYHLSKK